MAWEENKHPRDEDGQFTSKGNGKNIKDKVNDYFENYAFNDDADIDEVNEMLLDIEKELPFKDEQEHEKWLDVVFSGTGEEIEEFTKEIASRKTDDDFNSDNDFEAFDDDYDFENWEEENNNKKNEQEYINILKGIVDDNNKKIEKIKPFIEANKDYPVMVNHFEEQIKKIQDENKEYQRIIENPKLLYKN